MVQMVMRYKVSLTEAISDYCYCHIKINNSGKGITIVDLDDNSARKIIKKYNLDLAKGNYDYHDGRIYDDGKFKDFVNSNPKVKKHLTTLITKIDE